MKLLETSIRIRNDYIVVDDYVIIFLRRRNKSSLKCFINIDNFMLIGTINCRWHASRARHNGTYYASTTLDTCYGKQVGKVLHMHRLICNLGDFDDILCADHLDGNGLNNLRNNLEIKTTQENLFNLPVASNNTSGYRGVSYIKRAKHGRHWRASIMLNKKMIYEFYPTKEAANIAAIKLREKYFVVDTEANKMKGRMRSS